MPKRHVKKGDYLYLHADDADKVFFIHSGVLKIVSLPNKSHELILTIVLQGDVFGELSVFGGDSRMEYAQAIEDSVVCALDKNQVSVLMREVIPFREYIFKLIGLRISSVQKRLESMLFKDARTRIMEFIIDQAVKAGRMRNGVVNLPNYLTHQEIASYTGSSRQTVTTVLNQLREESLLEFDRKRFTILNFDLLQSMVNGHEFVVN